VAMVFNLFSFSPLALKNCRFFLEIVPNIKPMKTLAGHPPLNMDKRLSQETYGANYERIWKQTKKCTVK
jgi:hypothetical protein